ncbi:MAG: hypothetical protein ACKOCM_04475, partial [Cyanobacteriota bacterium]
PQRMAGRDPFLDRDVGEQKAAALLLTSHHGICDCSILAGIAGFFSELLRKLIRSRSVAGRAASDKGREQFR